jgi:elongation factor P--beta-lysine ligase
MKNIQLEDFEVFILVDELQERQEHYMKSSELATKNGDLRDAKEAEDRYQEIQDIINKLR